MKMTYYSYIKIWMKHSKCVTLFLYYIDNGIVYKMNCLTESNTLKCHISKLYVLRIWEQSEMCITSLSKAFLLEEENI